MKRLTLSYLVKPLDKLEIKNYTCITSNTKEVKYGNNNFKSK